MHVGTEVFDVAFALSLKQEIKKVKIKLNKLWCYKIYLNGCYCQRYNKKHEIGKTSTSIVM